MDEAAEEALFARMHSLLKGVPPSLAPGAAGGGETSGAATVARLEASVRALASGLDMALQRLDATEKGLDSRIEAAVARSTASLELAIGRLESVRADDDPAPSPVEPRRAGRRPFLTASVAVLALAAILGAGARFGMMPAADRLRPALMDQLGRARDILRTATSHTLAPKPAPEGQAPSGTASPAASPPAAAQPAAERAAPAAPGSQAAFTSPDPTAKPVQTAEQQHPAAAAPPTEPAAANTPPPPEAPTRPAGTEELTIRATAPVWVEVRNDNGKALVRRLFHPGDTWNGTSESGLRLYTGNAEGLVLSLNGKPYVLPGSGVLRDVRLSGGG